MKPQFVYVAGPYTGGDVVVNVRNAVLAGQRLTDAGFTPFVPHLYHLWHTIIPGDYEQWMKLDLAWLSRCDALIQLEGVSPGAQRERARAFELNLVVFDGVDAFLRAYPQAEGG